MITFPFVKSSYLSPSDIPENITADTAYTAVSGDMLFRAPIKFKDEMKNYIISQGLTIDREGIPDDK